MRHSVFHRFYQDASGNVYMLTMLMLLILVGTAGASIDLGRQQLVRIKLQQASDAAALAGALAPAGTDKATVAARYFAMNFPQEYLGVNRPNPSIRIGDRVTVSATADVETYFVRHIGTESIVSSGNSAVAVDAARNDQKYDLLLVMDVSGSMRDDDVGNSSSLEADNAGRAEGRRTCRFWELLGYRNYCQITYDSGTYGPTRLNAMRYAADYIASALLSENRTDNRVGTISWNTNIVGTVPMTGNYAEVRRFLLRMVADGGTDSGVAMNSAQNVTRNFRAGYIPAVVLITDGYNEPLPPRTQRQANEQTLNACRSMRESGVIVYTIAFGSTILSTSSAQDMLRDCASDDGRGGKHYYTAPDAATLSEVFATILGALKKVRIVE